MAQLTTPLGTSKTPPILGSITESLGELSEMLKPILAMALGGKKSPRVLVAWTVTALASLAAWKWLPANTHVVVGALAGGAIGFFWLERKPAPASDAEDSTHDR